MTTRVIREMFDVGTFETRRDATLVRRSVMKRLRREFGDAFDSMVRGFHVVKVESGYVAVAVIRDGHVKGSRLGRAIGKLGVDMVPSRLLA